MAFGSGVLISAVAFELTAEAFGAAGGLAVVIGLGAGALTFYLGDWILETDYGTPTVTAATDPGSAQTSCSS
jgi:ZIP family zinc transporter